MPQVIDSLKADHVNMVQLLDVLDDQIGALERGAGLDYEVLSGILEYCLTYPDLYHHPKEDLLYRALRTRRPEVLQGMGDLECLHRELAEQTRRLAAAVHQILLEAELDRPAVVELAKAFTAAYRHHIAMEEEYFFPAAENYLVAEDWSKIQLGLRVVADPLFDGARARDLLDLRQRVLRWYELSLTA